MMPFPGGLAATANATLVFSLAAAFFYFLMLERPVSPRRTLVKAAGVGLLAVLALVEGGPVLLVAALALSVAGDAFLAHEGKRAFLAGLTAFLLAHLAYVALFLATGEGAGIFVAAPLRALTGAAVLVLGAAMLARLWPSLGGGLRGPAAAYVAAILAMGLAALTHASALVAAGALLFIVSDAILAADKFLLDAGSAPRARAGAGRAVWALYYAGQLAIALGILL